MSNECSYCFLLLRLHWALGNRETEFRNLPIDMARAKDRIRKIRMIRRIGIMLRFQREPIVRLPSHPAATDDSAQIAAGREMNRRLCRPALHEPARFRVIN